MRLEELQEDLDIWVETYNRERTHSGKYCYGKTPMETFEDSKKLAKEKDLTDCCENMNFTKAKILKEEENNTEFSDNFQGTVLCVR